MKTKHVAKYPPVSRFWYWIKERHNIYLSRKAGHSRPWTDDEVLQQFFFTNPYRENDKVSQWYRKNIRNKMKGDDGILFATVAFRWFNKPDPTGQALIESGLLTKWNQRKATTLITKLHKDGPVFTGAYMIKAGDGPGSKIPAVCKAITNIWKARAKLIDGCKSDCRLEAFVDGLKTFPYLGSFMSYEVACDLRYTHLLSRAKDKMTWCNIGPGARRGLNRILKRDIRENIPKDMWHEETQNLLAQSTMMLPGMPKFEMREIEHSLCEFDKYERARTGSGRMKRRYNGVGQ